MNPFTKLYVAAVIGLGAFALTSVTPDDIPPPLLAATWLAAMVVVSLFKLRLPLQRGHATMSMAYVIDFVVLATAGPELAMIVAAAGVLVQCTVRVRRAQPWYRTAFSIATVVLAVKTAGLLWSGLGGTVSDPGLTTTAIAASHVSASIREGMSSGVTLVSASAPRPMTAAT